MNEISSLLNEMKVNLRSSFNLIEDELIRKKLYHITNHYMNQLEKSLNEIPTER